MNRDQQFKNTVLGWIKEELDNPSKPMVVTTLAEDPFGQACSKGTPEVEEDIIELTDDMIVEESTTALFKCEKCLFTAVVKKDLLADEYRMFCPRCDNTLFDEELKK